MTTAFSRVRHEKIVKSLIRKLLKKQSEKKIVRLFNGHDIMSKFKLEASPLIGRVLGELEEAQAIDKIKNKKEALKLAAKIIKSDK